MKSMRTCARNVALAGIVLLILAILYGPSKLGQTERNRGLPGSIVDAGHREGGDVTEPEAGPHGQRPETAALEGPGDGRAGYRPLTTGLCVPVDSIPDLKRQRPIVYLG